jgi:hypothetical protein
MPVVARGRPPGRASHRGQLAARVAAVAMHGGLLTVCASAVFTGWQRSIVSIPQWGATLLVAVALAASAATARGHLGHTVPRLLLALGGLMAFGLAYDPQLTAIPRLGSEVPEAFASAQPGVALLGTLVLLVAWLAYRSAGGESASPWPPFRTASIAATGLVLATAAFMFMLLHRSMGLPVSEALRPALALAQGGVLATVLTGSSGGPGIGAAPHYYLALSLVLAFARNMAFPME